MSSLLTPQRLWCRSEVLERPSPVPREPGAYAWYFREVPEGVPCEGCHRLGDRTLLYIGISPKKPLMAGAAGSTQKLYHRIRYHYRGNAEGSTLRLTLGCVLSEIIGIQLRRVGSGKSLTFSAGESALSEWMDRNAFVTWTVDPEPWLLEEELIARLSLPLNLDMNRRHPYHPTLSSLRRSAKETARRLPIAP
jgi:hypothetical protein